MDDVKVVSQDEFDALVAQLNDRRVRLIAALAMLSKAETLSEKISAKALIKSIRNQE